MLRNFFYCIEEIFFVSFVCVWCVLKFCSSFFVLSWEEGEEETKSIVIHFHFDFFPCEEKLITIIITRIPFHLCGGSLANAGKRWR